jgi:hypothetical protein
MLGSLPGNAMALTGPQKITFDDFGEGEPISTQYESQGVVFLEEDGIYPEIRWDEASFENPVLAGPFGFGSTIRAEFVEPGTTTPATVENLAMDVGYINEPGSTELTVEQQNGPFTLWANEEGFNRLFLGSPDITGFKVETPGFEGAGWGLDNLEYTIPTPPPPVSAPAPSTPAPTASQSNGCIEPNGSLLHQVLAGLKCKIEPTVVSVKCAVEIGLTVSPLKGFKLADGLYDASKAGKFAALARLYNDVKTAKILPDAPKGYQTTGQIIDKLEKAKHASDVIQMLPSLKQALSKKDFDAFFKDLLEIAGVGDCIRAWDGN